MAKKTTKKKARNTVAAKTNKTNEVAYQIVVSGGLKTALEDAHKRTAGSRKFRRLGSSRIHELAKEALDRGLAAIEADLDEELADLD